MLSNCHFCSGKIYLICRLYFHVIQNSRQPFDWRNPIGYLIACIEQYTVMAYFSTFAAAVVSLKIGCYLLVMEFMRDIKNDISLISQTVKSRRNQSDMLMGLPGSIKFHSHVEQLS